MMRILIPLFAAAALLSADQPRLRPPLWMDADDCPAGKPAVQEVSELFAIVNNSWLRHLSVEQIARRSHDRGAMNINAWDGVPDSSWFSNRIGRRSMTYGDLVEGLGGAPPQAGTLLIESNVAEGYTPKLRIRDKAGHRYWVKFDMPAAPERNSAAERISTLILHAAGYNVPANFVVRFSADDLQIAARAKFKDALGRERPMTPADLADTLRQLTPEAGGYYRALASQYISGEPLGKFKYDGIRKDDANDIIPHEMRRELRGLRVIASWINHADTGDKNTHDTFVSRDGKTGFVKHYLLDFGSTLGSGDYTNGPYRIGHEYLYDGSATAKTFFSLGVWRRPWEARGRIEHREVGYYSSDLFDPRNWRPNYPNLAFVRMDEADAWWGARIVLSFPDELIMKIVASAGYTRPEVAAYVVETLKARREMIGRYWLDAVTPVEGLRVVSTRLRFDDLAVDLGYVEPNSRRYRYWIEDAAGKAMSAPRPCDAAGCGLPASWGGGGTPDRFGRVLLGSVLIQSNRRDGDWAVPIWVGIGRNGEGSGVEILGWRRGTP